MPYRRLPNTDASRIRALTAALKKGRQQEIATIAYPMGLMQRIGFFLPKFEAAIINSRVAKETQSDSSPQYSEYTKKARLYISHFIQVLNFCIARGELKSSARAFYGLDENNSKVPSLLSEHDLLIWGEQIINGEQNRVSSGGGSPIYSPSIALVKANYEKFKDIYTRQKQFQNNTARQSSNVAPFRDDADALILEIWNHVERHHEGVKEEEEKREMCEEYGLVYVFRRGEKEKIRKRKEVDEITLKLF